MTESVAREMGKAVLHVDLSTMSMGDAVAAIGGWLDGLQGETLNVAGPRASSDPAIYEKAREVVARLLRGW
ncbi:MAG TPA: putative molybdenum carrier protein [Candidatus Krumholzibacteria bacterium]|nr:putative molybdenum carrier protein [Candidatus Krumholzibacteria bacterium]